MDISDHRAGKSAPGPAELQRIRHVEHPNHFDVVSLQGATGYQLYQFINNQAVLISAFGAIAPSASVGSLSPGTTYDFNLLAFNASGFAATAWIGVTTLNASSVLASSLISTTPTAVAQASHAVTDSAFAQYATVDYLPGRQR